jgi:hypothetical protein
MEYLAHRYVLHQRFPDGPGLLQHWMHLTFDNLHTEHHARPWDGNNINGTIRDTWLYMSFFAATQLPAPHAPVFWAAVMQSYVVEEWVHQSVHYVLLYGAGGTVLAPHQPPSVPSQPQGRSRLRPHERVLGHRPRDPRPGAGAPVDACLAARRPGRAAAAWEAMPRSAVAFGRRR